MTRKLCPGTLAPMSEQPTETLRDEDFLRLDGQICFALNAASRAFNGLYRVVLKDLGLTYPQYLVMLVLWEHGTTPVKELGSHLRLDSGTLSPCSSASRPQGWSTASAAPRTSGPYTSAPPRQVRRCAHARRRYRAGSRPPRASSSPRSATSRPACTASPPRWTPPPRRSDGHAAPSVGAKAGEPLPGGAGAPALVREGVVHRGRDRDVCGRVLAGGDGDGRLGAGAGRRDRPVETGPYGPGTA